MKKIPIFYAVFSLLLACPAHADPLAPDLRLKSADGAYSIAPHGRIVLDAGTGAGEGDLLLRRARLGVNGTLAQDFYYKIENDFSVDNVDHGLTDAYLGYHVNDRLALKIGQFKEPFSIETLTSSRFATFAERGITSAFVPGRRVGAMARSNIRDGDYYWTAALGAFDGGIGTSRTADDTQDVTGRVTFAPVAKPGYVLHAGLAASYRTPDNADDSISYSERPETRFSGGDSVDTGSITDTRHAMQWGLEAVGIWGPFAVQGEAIRADITRESGFADATLNGYYLQVSYYLTGESRTYLTERATFNRIKVNDPLSEGGWGAWQVAGRYSAIDLTDGGITGGELEDITLGLNWLPHSHVVVMGNVVFANNDDTGPTPGDDPTMFMLRMQYDF